MDRISEGTDALAQAAEGFNAGTLPRINRAADETIARGAHPEPRGQRAQREPADADLRRRTRRSRAGRARLPRPGAAAMTRALTIACCWRCWPAARRLPDKPMRGTCTTSARRARPPRGRRRRPRAAAGAAGGGGRRHLELPRSCTAWATTTRTSCGPTRMPAGARRPASWCASACVTCWARPRGARCGGGSVLARPGRVRRRRCCGWSWRNSASCSSRPAASKGVLRPRCTLLENTPGGERLVAQRSFDVRSRHRADAAGGVRALAAATDAAAQEIAAGCSTR